MKKFITLLTLLSVLASLLAMNVSAEATCQEVTIPRFTAKPTFDGFISTEEWGEPTVHVVTEGAATADDTEVGRNDEFGLVNTFYWYVVEDKDMNKNFYYDLWMRWDDQYFYIAAKVNDPDPFSQVNTWDGDTFQFALDLQGPGAIMKRAYPDFDYKTDRFIGTYKVPWSSEMVFMSVASLVKGEREQLWRSKGDWNIVKEAGGMVGITTTPHDDGQTCTNMYEIAVPWSVVAADGINPTNINDTFAPAAGDVYGITAVVCCTDSNKTNGWLQWGHGICYVSADQIQPRGTRGGSQAMVLGTEEVTPVEGYELAPETEATEAVTITLPPLKSEAETASADATTKLVGGNKDTGKTDGAGDGGISTPVIIAIAAGVAVAAAVVVIIVVKKKRK